MRLRHGQLLGDDKPMREHVECLNPLPGDANVPSVNLAPTATFRENPNILVTRATDTASRNIAFRLRFLGYNFESGHPIGDPKTELEYDNDDVGADIWVAWDRTGLVPLGTLRLISRDSTPDGRLPMERILEHFNAASIIPNNAAEISRVCIPRSAFRQLGKTGSGVRRDVLPALLRSAASTAIEQQILSLVALMEHTLSRRIRRLGLRPVPVGATIPFHGLRSPMIIPTHSALGER